jgi:ferric-dicitrate binding protein FerR (iron transport regulator)
VLVGLVAVLAGLALARPDRSSGQSPGDRLTSRPRSPAPPVKTIAVGDEIATESGQRQRLGLPDGSVLYVNANTRATLETPRRLKLTTGEVYLEDAAPPRPKSEADFVIHTPQRTVSSRGAALAVRLGKADPTVLVTRGQATVTGVKRPVRAGEQLRGAKPETAQRASHALAWTRDLRIAAESPLVPATRHAGGALIARDPNGQEANLSLRKFHIDVYIEDGFARTTIDQTYFNDSPSQLEGTFYFPLPADASLSRLAMYVEGEGGFCQLMEGGMVEANLGRRVYEDIRYANRDPALLEWLDGSTFKMRVFPIEGRKEKRLLLSYTQRLESLYDRTTYRFPAGHNLQTVRDWSIHARVKGGAEVAHASPSHTLKATREGKDLLLEATAKKARVDRDVVLLLTDPRAAERETARFSTAEHEGARYLMVRYRPELTAAPQQGRRHWVFLFESSGDRDPLLARVQIDLIRHALTQADPEDTFAVVAAGTRLRSFVGKPYRVTPRNVQAALAFLEQSHLVGALDLGKAFTAASDCLKEAGTPYLVHVGSGIPAMGERRLDALLGRLPEGTRYVGIGVGRRWNRSLMKAAAERTGGLFAQVNPDEPVGWRAFELFATLNTPRLLNVTVTDADSGRALLCHATSLAQGEEVCAVTRLEPKEEMPKSLVVRGSVAGKPYERVLAVRDATPQADYLPRTWAKLEIERLLAENAVKHRQKIIELSKAMYVMTPFTSLLVLENDDLYTQYKVDRGRKDHWAMYSAPAKIAVVYEPDPDQIDPKLLRSGVKLPARHVLKSIALRSQGGNTKAPARVGQILLTGNTVGRDWEVGLQKNPPLGFRAGQEFNFYLGLANSDSGSIAGAPATQFPSPVIIAGVERRLARLEGLRARAPGLGSPEEASFALRLRDEFRRQDRTPDFQPGMSDSEKRDHPGAPVQVWAGAERLLSGRKWVRTFGSTEQGRLLQEAADSYRNGSTADPLQLPLKEKEVALPPGGETSKLDPFVNRLLQGTTQPASLLYQRPSYPQDPLLFADIVRYAPGLNTSEADILAVLQAEAIPHPADRPGKIAPEARKLLDADRVPGWTRWTIERKEGETPLTILFDGSGRYAYERVLPLGLKERVVCDGKTLLHLYPQLGLAARRTVSRFHRADLADLVPWALPPADDLAHGADVKLLGERTIAIIPRGAETAKDSKGKPVPYARVQLLFGEDGRLAERQIVRMPKGEVLLRQVCTAEGVVRLLDAKGQELAVRKGTLAPGKAPNLKVKTTDLVVLPLPYRTRDHVRRVLKLEKKGVQELRFDEGLPLLTAAFAEGNSSEAYNLFRQVFHRRDQRQLGFYVLLAGCGMNLDAQNADVLAEHLDEPVAQYLALHSSPVLRKHASQWAVGSGQWGEGFLQHLAVSHALYQRWHNDKILKGNPARVKADVQRGLDYVRRHKATAWGWTLLCLMQDRAGEVKALHPLLQDNSLHASLAECFALFEKVAGLRYAARYEQARCLLRAGKQAEARKGFEQLYTDTLKDERLPAIDGDFRLALLGRAPEADRWNALLRSTAARLVESKRRPVVLALAWQCWQLGDRPLANSLLARTLHGIKEDKERLGMSLAAIQFLWQTAQLPQTDKLLQEVLAHKEWAQHAALWRLAAALAERRDQSARALECLEKALELEYAKLPEVIDLQAVRRDYGKLLGHYQSLADAMVTLKVQQPADFMARAVAAADRWRALDREPGAACQAVARILQRLGQPDLGWDYLTTPVGLRPNEAGPWVELAESLGHRGELQLADRAYAAAYEAEPTNAQILWDRAQNLRALGQSVEAGRLLRQIAEGRWQPRFQGVQALARIQTGME